MRKRKIIFVCTGNTCRSVMAELLFRKMVSDAIKNNSGKKALLENIEITSAGVAPMPGLNTAPGTVKALRGEGIEASGHRARRLTAEDVKEASLVLVMEERQKQEVSKLAGCCEDKIRMLSASAGGGGDIFDPFGHSIEIYNECMERIREALEGLLEKILKGEI